MRRLRILILIFCVALTIPLAYFVFQTYRSLEQEELAELRYFAETLFQTMEQELASLVLREEGRAIDEYSHEQASPVPEADPPKGRLSPLSRLPREPYILGYFQSNPDGSFQSPLVAPGAAAPADRAAVVSQLMEANELFNRRRTSAPEPVEAGRPKTDLKKGREQEGPSGFAGRYLDLSRSARQKDYLGKEERRVEEIAPGQALNLAQRPQGLSLAEGPEGPRPAGERPGSASGIGRSRRSPLAEGGAVQDAQRPTAEQRRYQVEVDPLQSVHLDDDRVFIFRRIVVNNEVFRQGVVLTIRSFLEHLAGAHFAAQPMARFTGLTLRALDGGRETTRVQAGVQTAVPRFSLNRGFPRPFSFLRATLSCERIPRSPGRDTLGVMVIVLGVVIVAGLFAIYQSARVVMDLSERRAGFVSSVTHELKTPLTNIRLYIEMLEQGIAADPERELEYYRILANEAGRLSRLINNVLEFSKLEKRQRQLDLREGTLEEVIQEVTSLMGENLRQEGFTLRVERGAERPFRYDREVMVQVLMNLMENSLKFGRASPRKEIALRIRSEGNWAKVTVSDTGPGIPRHALRKVFDDFYRVDDPLIRSTKGTGIGLALVRRFVEAMGGSVTAANNQGPGCTITVSLPLVEGRGAESTGDPSQGIMAPV